MKQKLSHPSWYGATKVELKETPDMRLKKMARSAILKVNGDTEKARDLFNNKIITANDAALERELCAAYRNTAIRAILATHYQELRAEGKLPTLHSPTSIQTTDYEQTQTRDKPRRPSDWIWDDDIGMTATAHVRRYLRSFLVNGKPIGDCRVEEVDASADSREEDIRFMRNLVTGLPPTAIVGEHRTEEDAAKIWSATHLRDNQNENL